ncbi:MAG TPA: tyrosine--tRNA ligase [Candidatus Avichristensenella intestinipullorum]|uniref:Tyrosine--tRNA ligase n=1 Tax=Candidatus Avichristensenella intestinipullorum TaxID=2840693 RepID=A0A9D0YWJ4_9FIRM|nr:tyrosine--tRNA ligase [Candidatus Avichristensenella intestinipullorum]
MHILDVLKERGFIAQVTFEEELYQQLETPTTFYVGFDPTADSLTIGHYIPIMAMAHMQRAGHRPIALMGGGTGMIGDPSNRSDLRRMLTTETIDHNVACIQKQMSSFLDFSDGKALIVNNADWLRNLNYIEFLREIGVHFSVNQMLTAECYRQRMEKGLTFLEFNYMLMQGYDFLELFRRYGCRLQMGGDDQWSNMLAGADLVRRKEREKAFALTCKLLLTHDGKKMGKTEKGALWLDPNRTSPYQMYQYWRNVNDADVEKCLALLTFLPMDEVRRLGSLQGSELNEAKKVLALEVTALVHGREEAEKARDAASSLFGGGDLSGSVPTTELTRAQLEEDGRLTTLLALVGLAKSRGAARKLVEQNAVRMGEEKVTDVEYRLSPDAIPADGLLLRVGKKSYHRLVLK